MISSMNEQGLLLLLYHVSDILADSYYGIPFNLVKVSCTKLQIYHFHAMKICLELNLEYPSPIPTQQVATWANDKSNYHLHWTPGLCLKIWHANN